MNKKAKRRAFFICAAIFVMYVMVGSGLQEKLSMKRIAHIDQEKPVNMGIYTQKPAARTASFTTPAAAPAPVSVAKPVEVATPKAPAAIILPPPPVPASIPGVVNAHTATPLTAPKAVAPPREAVYAATSAFMRPEAFAEPSLFISVPIICHAIREGFIEKEGLIFIKKDGYNNPKWKKTLDILKDKDEEGLRSISKAIGKKQILDFLKKEGITQKQGIPMEDIILGKGYGVEKKKLLSLYDKYVRADYPGLFPFSLEGLSIAQNRNGFEFQGQRDVAKERRGKEDPEWMVPNLTNLTMKDAFEKLSAHTAKIKIYGSGNVVDQNPKPFQRTRGEAECIIYGRTYR
ncbi:MAG: hypothetical protein C0392_00825 [Syntrophus sp. (in: bacteria)]|nr:hypothetical protein [Syntrophus sp. (in: bacteria)]